MSISKGWVEAAAGPKFWYLGVPKTLISKEGSRPPAENVEHFGVPKTLISKGESRPHAFFLHFGLPKTPISKVGTLKIGSIISQKSGVSSPIPWYYNIGRPKGGRRKFWDKPVIFWKFRSGGGVGGWGVFWELPGIRPRNKEFTGIRSYGWTQLLLSKISTVT